MKNVTYALHLAISHAGLPSIRLQLRGPMDASRSGVDVFFFRHARLALALPDLFLDLLSMTLLESK
jgi:hypothetical protein